MVRFCYFDTVLNIFLQVSIEFLANIIVHLQIVSYLLFWEYIYTAKVRGTIRNQYIKIKIF